MYAEITAKSSTAISFRSEEGECGSILVSTIQRKIEDWEKDSDGLYKIGSVVPIYKTKGPNGEMRFFVDKFAPSWAEQGYAIDEGKTDKWLEESEFIELKSSMEIPATRKRQSAADAAKEQMKEIASSLAAFNNSRIIGTLIVGVSDRGEVKGFPVCLSKWGSVLDYEANVRNRIGILVGSSLFASTLKFTWTGLAGNLYVVQIAITTLYSLLLVSGSELYIRSGASKMILRGRDHIDYIIDHSQNKY